MPGAGSEVVDQALPGGRPARDAGDVWVSDDDGVGPGRD
jgi:hypothetical protein